MKGIGELLEGVIAYTRRHFKRLDRLERDSFILDSNLASMLVIEPEGNEEKFENKDATLSTAVDSEQLSEIAPMEQDQHHADIKEKIIQKAKISYINRCRR
ncbi:hypothetical protein A4A49_52940 [Nicotiana attenuata]|uniref:U3 small nucleolar RNA-associated protein 13 C-terminal domain-containing protein n=1 Tax=Nicotiana attenuata TaxID=49451 RepID=A0A1J6IA88_NICAT|nr:hypothetical protein A4A49_52940 [Nicotiana attenuata]